MASCYVLSIPHKIVKDDCKKKLKEEFIEAKLANTSSVVSLKVESIIFSSSDSICVGKKNYFNRPGGKVLPFTSYKSSISS